MLVLRPASVSASASIPYSSRATRAAQRPYSSARASAASSCASAVVTRLRRTLSATAPPPYDTHRGVATPAISGKERTFVFTHARRL